MDQFKKAGSPIFVRLLAVPDRIPDLVKGYGKEKVHAVVMALLTEFTNSFNLIRPITSDQITQCAFDMIETSGLDYLSMEDFVMFFDQARMGKYGKIYDHMDPHTILLMLEKYREDREAAYFAHKESRHAELKGLGPSDRVETDELQSAMFNILGRMENMKERLKEKQ